MRAPVRTRLGPGFTLTELLLVVMLLGILATLAVNQAMKAKTAARNGRAASEVRTLASEIDQYEAIHGTLPATLADIGRGGLLDPWGKPYVYLNFGGIIQRKPGGGGGSIAGRARKDKNLVPLNTTYDLYSKGADGLSQLPLTASVSRDDIVRANDGSYIGLAAGY